ncbi:uncharacterized protein LOC142356847 [Convolutriloba macropyga]|uniref:uncharacterized protein LOC142356847 n=1 Tax=Convolutriloba macropyga TaxID=536237 RepID=UPI003F523B39
MTGKQCRKHSLYYCLEGYNTLTTRPHLTKRSQLNECLVRKNKELFSNLMQDIWQHINMIDLQDPKTCCAQQTEQYLSNGLMNQQMSPEQYLASLTNYNNEDDKPVNFVSAAYIREFCINMIFEIGFGPGQLVFDSRFELEPKLPFAIAGIEYGITGLPHIKTRLFHHDKLSNQLTFHWFKHKIMCLDNPWICQFGERNRTGLDDSRWM